MEFFIFACKTFLVLIAVGGVVMPLISEWGNFEFVWKIWKRFRIRMFFEVSGIILLLIFAMTVLWEVPYLKYGWINLFYESGGNIVIVPIMEGTKSTNFFIRLMVPLYFIVFILVMPFLVRSEEDLFRKGISDWWAIVKRSIAFGMVHCLVGVPIAAGIALIIPGFFFACKYRGAYFKSLKMSSENFRAIEDGVMESVTYHTLI